MKTISVITVNYNHNHITEALLYSIEKTNTYPLLEIIVVDNGSRNNPVPQWRTQFPKVTFIRSELNLGFAGGNNLGIGFAKGDYYFLVNNDTEFTPKLADLLAETLDNHPEVGIVSPKILYFDKPGMLQYAGFTPMNYFTMRNKCIGQFETDNGQYDHATGVTGFAHGAAMMIRRQAIENAGTMDENFFLYYEEMDWCESIRRGGYAIWVNMQAKIYHKESVSVGKNSPLKEYFMNRNRILFARRNATAVQKYFFYLYFIIVLIPRNMIMYIRNKQFDCISPLFRAIGWNLRNGIHSSSLGYSI